MDTPLWSRKPARVDAAVVASQVGIASLEEGAQDIGVAQEHLDFGFSPILCRNLLHELEELVKVHLLELAAELRQKGGTDVNVKILEAVSVLLAYVGVPQSNDAFEVEFSKEQAVHPFEGKLHELYAHRMDVLVQISVDSIDQFLQPHYHSLDSGLICRVMVLNACQDVGQTPVDIGLDLHEGKMSE